MPPDGAGAGSTRARYLLLCTGVGLAISWIPSLFHGPAAAKFDILYIRGSIAVWGWYVARMAIGFLVGATYWPPIWWVRGPLIGALTMLPLGITSIATPGCGWP